MKLAVCGGRDLFIKYEDLDDLINKIHDGTGLEIVSGGASGIDTCAVGYAGLNNIPYIVFNADWESYGKKAGPMRNKKIAEYSEALLLIWDGKSRGSSSMKKEMTKLKKPVLEILVTKTTETHHLRRIEEFKLLGVGHEEA